MGFCTCHWWTCETLTRRRILPAMCDRPQLHFTGMMFWHMLERRNIMYPLARNYFSLSIKFDSKDWFKLKFWIFWQKLQISVSAMKMVCTKQHCCFFNENKESFICYDGNKKFPDDISAVDWRSPLRLATYTRWWEQLSWICQNWSKTERNWRTIDFE